jgi:hypothetical protein
MNNKLPFPTKKDRGIPRVSPLDLNPTESPEEVKVERPVVVTKKTTKKVEERIPYTATMEKKLKKRVKRVVIDLGITISEYIEIAIKEKLDRDGDQ